jgi:hypothetical protein
MYMPMHAFLISRDQVLSVLAPPPPHSSMQCSLRHFMTKHGHVY